MHFKCMQDSVVVYAILIQWYVEESDLETIIPFALTITECGSKSGKNIKHSMLCTCKSSMKSCTTCMCM